MTTPIKTLTALGLIAGLSGCFAPPAPITQDKDGRAVVTGAEGANAFLKMCYKSGGKTPAVKRVVKRDANFTSDSKPGAPFYSAKHKTRSIDVITLGDSGCSVSFKTSKPSAQGAADTAIALIKPVGAKGIGGKKGGGQINLKTVKGMVVVGNAQKISSNSVQVMLFGK